MTQVLAGEVAFTESAARDITGAIERMVTRAPSSPAMPAPGTLSRVPWPQATPNEFGLEEQPRTQTPRRPRAKRGAPRRREELRAGLAGT